MKPKILIIGSTGKLGIKLLNYCKKVKLIFFVLQGTKILIFLVCNQKNIM